MVNFVGGYAWEAGGIGYDFGVVGNLVGGTRAVAVAGGFPVLGAGPGAWGPVSDYPFNIDPNIAAIMIGLGDFDFTPLATPSTTRYSFNFTSDPSPSPSIPLILNNYLYIKQADCSTNPTDLHYNRASGLCMPTFTGVLGTCTGMAGLVHVIGNPVGPGGTALPVKFIEVSKAKDIIAVGSGTDRVVVYQIGSDNLYHEMQRITTRSTLVSLTLTDRILHPTTSQYYQLLLIATTTSLTVYRLLPATETQYTTYFSYPLIGGITLLSSSITSTGTKIVSVYRNPTQYIFTLLHDPINEMYTMT